MNCKTSARSKVSIMPLCRWRKCHMIEAVIGHGQLYVFILCLALKPHSTVPSDKGTVREGDGSVWPLTGVAYQHRKCPWPRTTLTFSLHTLLQWCSYKSALRARRWNVARQTTQHKAQIWKRNHANKQVSDTSLRPYLCFFSQVSAPARKWQVFWNMPTAQKHLTGMCKMKSCIIQGSQELPKQNGFERPICVAAKAKYLHFNGSRVTVYTEHFNKSQQYSFWIWKLALLLKESFKPSNICTEQSVYVLLQSTFAANSISTL